MPRESLGYVHMVWVCPNCQNKNPGNFRFCRGCGAPQPVDVKFVQDDQQNLISDAKEIEQAKQGADVHCGFCGARNPSNAKDCQACGADLASGTKRTSGTVIGAFQNGPAAEVPCPNCGTMNPANALSCKGCGASLGVNAKKESTPAAAKKGLNWVVLAGIGVVIAAIIFFVILSSRTSDLSGTVSKLAWNRSISVLGLQPVQRQDWKSKIPSGASVGKCDLRLSGTSEQPAENSKKVCGTPYSVDKGNGYAEVVQDCSYEIYENYCSYTIQDWVVVNTAVQKGTDQNPSWPEPQLAQGQKLGDQAEAYTIVFLTDEGEKIYQTSDPNEFMSAVPHTRWTLKVNSFGSVVAIEPLD
jgi:ribosomal protein L40E